jgi:TPR repeat protein
MAQMQEIGALVGSASQGNGASAFELGMAYSSGSGGLPVDLVQAHRWLNVATLCGYAPAAAWRQEIAMEMERGDVVEAQRLARATIIPMRKAA